MFPNESCTVTTGCADRFTPSSTDADGDVVNASLFADPAMIWKLDDTADDNKNRVAVNV